MSDVSTWRVMTDERNPNDVDPGVWIVCGWPKGADTETAPASTCIAVEQGGRALADLLVASLQATSQVAENVLAEAAKEANRGIDPRGWRYGPMCARCRDTGAVAEIPDLPHIVGHCDCKVGRRLLDLHIAEKARDDADFEEVAEGLLGGREHPDDLYVDPDAARSDRRRPCLKFASWATTATTSIGSSSGCASSSSARPT